MVIFSRLAGTLILMLGLQLFSPNISVADEVLDWNTIAVRAMQVAPAVPGYLQPRTLTIVHVSIFDALNGIDHRYPPIHVNGEGPNRASQRAAVVQAAYRALVTMFPAQVGALNSDLETSIAAIATTGSPQDIQHGRDWGDEVALAILAWRAGDNPAPSSPYVGSLDVGKWRPTPRPGPGGSELAGIPGLGPLFASSPPFLIPETSSYRPEGPPDLSSSEYARDVNEVKRVGNVDSVYRTADQT
jgi:hypothetical protein